MGVRLGGVEPHPTGGTQVFGGVRGLCCAMVGWNPTLRGEGGLLGGPVVFSRDATP
jgi:hypothetical protein